VNVWAAEQLGKVLHQRIDAMFGERTHDTCESGEGMGTSAVFSAVRHLAGDDHQTQGSFRPIVGRLDSWLDQETQHVAPIVMPAQFIEQPLVVRAYQSVVPHLIGWIPYFFGGVRSDGF